MDLQSKRRNMEVIKIDKLRLYLETTVFNYYFDKNRPGHYDVVRLFVAVEAGLFYAYTSEYVIQELRKWKIYVKK